MSRTGTGLAVCLLAMGPLPVRASVYGDAGAGGGYETNVTAAPAAEPSGGSPTATAWAALGASWLLSFDDELFAELAYDGSVLTELRELDLHRGSLSAGYVHWFGDRFYVRLAGSGGYRAYGDAKRNGWDYGAAATGRWRWSRAWSLRLSGGWTGREATDAFYSSDAVRGRVGLDLRPWDHTRFGVSAAVEWMSPRNDVTASPGAPIVVLGQELQLDGADGLVQLYGADVWHDFGAHVFAVASYGYVIAQWSGGGYRSHVFSAALGFRL